MKTTTLKIADGLSLPADTVTSTLVVYGGKGMGKTNFGAVLVEELTKAGLRWCALDPLGVWWGLRHAGDGKGPGIECVILGGFHGDIPIEPTGGAVAADLVVDEPANVVIDFSRKPSGEMWTIGEKTRFITDYALRLFQRQGELVEGTRREPVFQILDEAARYIPQIIPAGNPQLAMCLSAWNTLVEEGRNIGIGVGLLTQRSARMAKSVSELADAMFSFRIVGPNSIGAVTDWLGEHVDKKQVAQHVETLRSLERGKCLLVSPGWLHFEGVINIRFRETFDSSATPKPGERVLKVRGEGAKPDLTKYIERMHATIEKAKENDPKALRKRIEELKRELEAASRKKAEPGVTTKVVTPNLSNLARIARELESAAIDVKVDQAITKTLAKQRRLLQGGIERLRAGVSLLNATGTEIKPSGAKAPATTGRPKARPLQNEAHAIAAAENNGHLSNSQLRILGALAQFEGIGRTPVQKKWIAALAGASHSSSAYGNNLGYLRSSGYIDYPSPGAVALTDVGREKAPEIDPPATTSEMIERCKRIISRSQARIIDVLAEQYPKSIDKVQLAEAAGVSATSSAYGNNLGALRAAGMIDYPDRGLVRAADWLFLEAA